MITVQQNNWYKTKEMIKNMIKEDQIKDWIQDAHGRILKKYQNEWNYNKTFAKVYDKQKGHIRRLNWVVRLWQIIRAIIIQIQINVQCAKII